MKVRFDYNKLRKARQEKRITQFELAELSGTTDRYIRAIEKGQRTNPSAIILYRAALALGMSVEDFMLFTDEGAEDKL